MPEETTTIDYVMEAASGPHFSGLRLDGLLSSPPSASSSSPASAASNRADPNATKQPFVIGVSGGTASGKTTVCDMIIQQLHDHRVVLVNQDSFYRGLTPEESERVHEYNFDHPDAFDTEQLLECVQKLKCGQSVQVRFMILRSIDEVNASDVIILEGILYAKFVKPAFDDFVHPSKKYADVIIPVVVVEHGLGHLPFTEKQVVTPTGKIWVVRS
ncbi:hypothetical protein GBA52_011749 [Prunus armeniaca]|nr:hypothetical protein GBA52_011749 [Prunus armeniaca]